MRSLGHSKAERETPRREQLRAPRRNTLSGGINADGRGAELLPTSPGKARKIFPKTHPFLHLHSEQPSMNHSMPCPPRHAAPSHP